MTVRMTFKLKTDAMSRFVNKLTPTLGFPTELERLVAKRYETYLKRRFNILSRGGSVDGTTWKPTKYRRPPKSRKRKQNSDEKKKTYLTLRDTGTLYKAIQIGKAGNSLKKIRGGVRYGILGSGRHPRYDGKIRTLAMIHQLGKGNNPKRPILAEPDKKTGNAIRRLIDKYVKQQLKKAGRR